MLDATQVGANVMQLTLDQVGDFSVYCVCLQDPDGADWDPPGFDPDVVVGVVPFPHRLRHRL